MILTIDKKLPQNLKLNLNLSLSYPRKKVSYCCFLIWGVPYYRYD